MAHNTLKSDLTHAVSWLSEACNRYGLLDGARLELCTPAENWGRYGWALRVVRPPYSDGTENNTLYGLPKGLLHTLDIRGADNLIPLGNTKNDAWEWLYAARQRAVAWGSAQEEAVLLFINMTAVERETFVELYRDNSLPHGRLDSKIAAVRTLLGGNS